MSYYEDLHYRIRSMVLEKQKYFRKDFASRIQKAATILTEFASSVGSICSMIRTSGHDSDSYYQADTLRRRINTTRFIAENALLQATELMVLSGQPADRDLANAVLNNDIRLSFKKSSREHRLSFKAFRPAFRLPPGISFVKEYGICIVKANAGDSFSILQAEAAVADRRFIEAKHEPNSGRITMAVGANAIDTNGEKLIAGEEYVLFVLVTFSEEYKKLINCFGDWLSAPSPVFCFMQSSEGVKSRTPADREPERRAKKLARTMKLLADKTIFSVELFNKLSNLIVRRKTTNPLISDDLISKIIDGGAKANKAVETVIDALMP